MSSKKVFYTSLTALTLASLSGIVLAEEVDQTLVSSAVPVLETEADVANPVVTDYRLIADSWERDGVVITISDTGLVTHPDGTTVQLSPDGQIATLVAAGEVYDGLVRDQEGLRYGPYSWSGSYPDSAFWRRVVDGATASTSEEVVANPVVTDYRLIADSWERDGVVITISDTGLVTHPDGATVQLSPEGQTATLVAAGEVYDGLVREQEGLRYGPYSWSGSYPDSAFWRRVVDKATDSLESGTEQPSTTPSPARASADVSLLVPTSGALATKVVDTVRLFDETGKELYNGSANGYTTLSDLLVSLGLPATASFTNADMGLASDGSVYLSGTVLLPAPSETAVVSPADQEASAGSTESGTEQSLTTPSPVRASADVSLLVPTSGALATKVVDTVRLFDESGKELYNGSANGYTTLSDLLVSLGLPATASFTNADMGLASDGSVYLSGTVLLPAPSEAAVVSPADQAVIANQPGQDSTGGATLAVGAHKAALAQSAANPSSYSRTERAQAKASAKSSKGILPSTGEVVSVLGLIGAGLSVLGLSGLKHRRF